MEPTTIVTVSKLPEAALLAQYTIGPSNVCFRDLAAALLFSQLARSARLEALGERLGDEPAKVAAAAVDLADALVSELVRRQREAREGGVACKAA